MELVPVGPGNMDISATVLHPNFFYKREIKNDTISIQQSAGVVHIAYDRYAGILMHLEDMDHQPVCSIIYSSINMIQMHVPKQQKQKMSISYITEVNDKAQDEHLFQSSARSDSLPPPHELVAQKCLRKCQLSVRI